MNTYLTKGSSWISSLRKKKKEKTRENSSDMITSDAVLDNYRRGLYFYLYACAISLQKSHHDMDFGVEGVGLMKPWHCYPSQHPEASMVSRRIHESMARAAIAAGRQQGRSQPGRRQQRGPTTAGERCTGQQQHRQRPRAARGHRQSADGSSPAHCAYHGHLPGTREKHYTPIHVHPKHLTKPYMRKALHPYTLHLKRLTKLYM
jgi:hypothetical protein